MNKTKKLKKLIKKINKMCTKRYGNITEPDKAMLEELSKNVFMASIKSLEFDENNTHLKAIEVFQIIIQQTNIPEETFNKYAEKEIDYIIRFIKQFIVEMKKNENN